MSVQIIPASGIACRQATSSSSFQGRKMSSESSRAIMSPRALRSPVLRAMLVPLWGWRTRRTRASLP